MKCNTGLNWVNLSKTSRELVDNIHWQTLQYEMFPFFDPQQCI